MAVEKGQVDKECANGALTAMTTNFVLVHFFIHQISLLMLMGARKNVKMGMFKYSCNSIATAAAAVAEQLWRSYCYSYNTETVQLQHRGSYSKHAM